MKVLVVFPGWGTPKKLYQKLDLAVDQKKVITDFNLIDLKEKLANYKQEQLIFCGWSLGAMRALKCLEYISVDKLILLAPTLNFLENQPEIIVKKMKRNLKANKLETLKDFTKLNFHQKNSYQNYIQQYQKYLKRLDSEKLKRGLDFLLTKDMTDLHIEQELTPLIITGEEDQIIKNKSSKRVVDKFESSKYYTLSGVGHNLIYEAEERVNQIIKNYLYKA